MIEKIEKLVSGGQTGVDRAALDIAIELSISYGGWCPKGRLAEDGVIPEKYEYLKETNTSDYSQRTKLNIKDSDGTLILKPPPEITITDGTVLTEEEVKKQKKPYLIIDLSQSFDEQIFFDWIEENQIKILNVAGPRESQSKGIYDKSKDFLMKILKKNESRCRNFFRSRL